MALCAHDGCSSSFQKKVHNQRYCSYDCKRAADALRKREARNARAERNDRWGVNKNVSEGETGERHRVSVTRGGEVDVRMQVSAKSGDVKKAAEEQLLALLREVFGDHSAIVDLIDLKNLRFTFGRHSNGEMTVWVKVPPPVGLTDHASTEVVSNYIERIKQRPKRAVKKPMKDGRLVDFGIEFADGQLGKGTQEKFGDGPDDTVERVDWFVDEAIPQQIENIRSLGHHVNSVEVGLLGDLTEGCYGSYENQPFTVLLNAADQLELALALVDRLVESLVDLGVDNIRLTGVSSNHDQMSRGDKGNITDAFDDRTFVILRSLARAYSKNPDRYEGVRVEMPVDPNVACITTSQGLKLARIHGHLVSGGKSIADKMWVWWRDQMSSGIPGAGGAHILSTAHYHHGFELRQNGRILVGNPALDNGSQWLTDLNGQWSVPGLRVWTFDGESFDTSILTSPQDRERMKSLTGFVV